MRILLGLSGGVDSTYAIKALRDAGHDVECAVAVMHGYTDLEAAKESAAALGVKLHIIDACDEFEKHVVENFVSEYSRARTPNPCVVCNRYVKIATLCDFAKSNGFDKVATGHYVGIAGENGRFAVQCGRDSAKDQSYVLWRLTQEQISMLMTPLFDKDKMSVRAETKGMGLNAADRKDSQEICFIPDNDYAAFIEKRIGNFPEGNFVDTEGNILGRHKGIIHYTIGQRKGLGIALGQPVFVTAIDPASNTVTLAPKGGEFVSGMIVGDLNFQFDEPFEGKRDDLKVKVRYAAKPVSCEIEIKNGTAKVVFAEKVRAVTPGQSAVFYKNDVISFGGSIETTVN